jgi:hypothetical protein
LLLVTADAGCVGFTLSIAFMVGWHTFHMKSTLGVAIDTAPNIQLIVYILASKRVKWAPGRYRSVE